ncbi:MAG: sigma-54 dependent transcriptional regulator [Thermodesulfobacteriota bacterium]|jgi:transcriptional regulator with PAS, ATPase and Fis domain
MKDIYQVIFSNSHKMSEIKSIIYEIAKTDITVLIKGESGTGKELLAKAIHLNSQRKDKPFVKVDCAAIPKGILQSELFGFEKDALTGAYFQKLGKFELLDGGTILLNDIGEMDISIQAKLLQVLQDGMFSHSGEDGDVIVNTRVVATTKDHLVEKSMTEGFFREGLFSKINFVSINVPPLRDRKEQFLPLSQYYFNFYKKKYGKDIPPFSSKVIDAFKEYAWPGNIRELENMVKRIVIDGKEDTVLQNISSNRLNDRMNPGSYENLSPSLSAEKKSFKLKEMRKKAAETAEMEIIHGTLQKTRWNRKRAAKLLGIGYNALLYKIQKYNLG